MYIIINHKGKHSNRYPFLEDAIFDCYEKKKPARVHQIGDFCSVSDTPTYRNQDPIPDWVFDK